MGSRVLLLGTLLRAGHGSGTVLGGVGYVDGGVLGLLDRDRASRWSGAMLGVICPGGVAWHGDWG